MFKFLNGFLCLSIFAVLFSASYTPGGDPFEAFSVLRSQKKTAANFSLPQINGKIVKLSDYKGKVVLLGFFKTF